MITSICATCQFEGCDKPAVVIACGCTAHRKPGCYCREHGMRVAEEGDPEYLATCPNCGCISGTGN
jgi:hypothetical protein